MNIAIQAVPAAASSKIPPNYIANTRLIGKQRGTAVTGLAGDSVNFNIIASQIAPAGVDLTIAANVFIVYTKMYIIIIPLLTLPVRPFA